MDIREVVEYVGFWKPMILLMVVPLCVYGTITVFVMALKKISEKTYPGSAALIKAYAIRPLRLMAVVAVMGMLLPVTGWPSGFAGLLRHVLALAMIGLFAWFLINATLAGRCMLLGRYDVSVSDNLRARSVMTQVNILLKVLWVIILMLAVASMLMTFEKIRQLGISMLASAGLIGVVAGFAAQKSLATLAAGIQVAITQPIRLDDVVVVEGEWGRIEEITLTYVVIRIWDERRLVVPMSQFLERSFQNWTRTSAQILGTVFFWTDYTVPLAPLRQELERIVADSSLWDGRVCLLQVTEAGEHALQLRALVSAGDSGKCWDLRCEVREKILDYVQRHYPGALPRLRAGFDLVNSAGMVSPR